jgi:hypothetical protein
MALLIIDHVVGDRETFRQVYLDDEDRRRRLGSKGGRVWMVSGNPNDIRVALEFETAEQAARTPRVSSCTRPSSGPRETCRCPCPRFSNT